MGYDEDFYSVKSWVFVVSIHVKTDQPFMFSIGDALDTDYNEQAHSISMYEDFWEKGKNG